MAQADLSELESFIRKLPGVLGCVALANPDGTLAEVQAFTRVGVDQEEVEAAILGEAGKKGLSDGAGRVFVFELDAESHLGDRESLHRAAEMAEQEARSKGPLGVLHPLGTLHSLAETGPEPPRPARALLRRVLLSSSSEGSEAEVTLGTGEEAVRGTATGVKTSHGAEVVAEATLQAAAQVIPGLSFTLLNASVETVAGRQVVAVLIQEDDERELVGAALVRDAPVSEATVRATLDAINRRMTPGG
jgi:hypothetical protein